MLVLIDNASSSAQVRQLLPASPQCCVVVTSRSALPGLVAREGAVRVTLDTLSPEESVRLLSEAVGSARIEAKSSSALRVAELCGHLPLALRVVAERAAGRPRLSMAELVEEIVGEQHRLDALASDEDELTDVRAVFSWSYQALDPALRQAFRRLGLHAGGEIGIEAAAALMGIGVAGAKRRLRALADAHLLQEITVNRFRLHDLLRSYSVERALADETQEERTQAVRRVLSWYLLTADAARRAYLPYSPAVPLVPAGQVEVTEAFADGPEAMRWFETERLNLLAALRQAIELGQYDIGWKLPMATTGFYELQSHVSDWENNHRIGLQSALALGDPLGEATNRVMLGDVAWRLGRWVEATDMYEHVARLAHDLSVGWLEGFALRGLGLVQEAQENFDAAAELFDSALSVFRSSDFRRGEGMSLLSLGKCARSVGDLSSAVAYGAEAVATFEDIQDTWTVAWGKVALAESLTDLGRRVEAVAHLRSAVEVFRRFGDQRSETLGLLPLGELLLESGDADGARDCWSKAADLQEALRDPTATETRARLAGLEPHA
ncbi:tetratricopeptide repeat protein [Actinomadura alba]|uniref:Tetratricopeptide repeat protein n=2 Tax=Actinomadura alba TaxID=406431 RepID=A0ABR7LK88_9ACTN|nr:tetratricopeptide repeat protein [Actinomadura alba]